MSTDPSVEALARHLCEQDGNIPDRLVGRWTQPEHARGLARSFQYVPVDDAAMPAWQLYIHMAASAIQFLRDGLVTETQVRLVEPCALAERGKAA